jgi:acyl-CoA thioester hydrolase
MPEFKFHLDLRPRFFDLDAFRHVNNAVYLTYCEEDRAAYCRRLGIFLLQDRAEPVSFVIARAELEFKSPVTYGEELRVFIRAEKFSRHGFELAYRIESLTRRRLVLTARTKCVCWDVEGARLAALPERERAAMAAFEADGPAA